MTDAVETTEDVEDVEVSETVEVEEAESEQVEEDPAAGLRKALAAERKAHKEADRRARAAEQALADKDKPAEEAALDAARREAREEALAQSNQRLVRAELKAALAGKVSNLNAALKLTDISEIEVDANGDVDSDAIAAAVDDFLEEYPELAAQKRLAGADQGAKGKSAAPAQLTQSDLKNMTPEQINTARKAGQLNRLLGVSS